MKIVALGHHKRVGKDTACRFLLSHLRQNFPNIRSERVSMGDQIKSIAKSMFGWGGLEDGIFYENHPHLIEEILPPIGRSPRFVWDSLGMFGPTVCERLWTELAFQYAGADLAIISDLKRPSEVEFFRQFPESLIIRVDRDSAPLGGRVDQLLDNYEGWDLILKNNGTLKEFNLAIREQVVPLLEL
jgi:hypothetical protein